MIGNVFLGLSRLNEMAKKTIENTTIVNIKILYFLKNCNIGIILMQKYENATGFKVI